MDYGGVRYLTNNEVGKILDGLLFLTEDGFKERYHRESQKVEPCPYIDWSEEEMLDWLTDYYREIVEYYYDPYHDRKALLLYLT